MPLGNGRQALNVWLEASGDVCFYLATGDAWGEFGQLYKVGGVRVRVTDDAGEPVFGSELLSWSLDLLTASIRVESSRASLRIWVDAHHPCVQVRCVSKEADGGLRAVAKIERWRDRKRVLSDPAERHFLHSGAPTEGVAPYEVFHGPDEFCDVGEEAIGWYHCNESSSWKSNLAQQGMLDWAEETAQQDPLLNRIFGAVLQGAGWEKVDAETLATKSGTAEIALTVTQLTQCPSTPPEWISKVLELCQQCPGASEEAVWENHCAWWREFWGRSWIHIDGSEAARKISRGYALQRYMSACAGRGEFPIKFNGSLFTADWHLPGEDFGPDHRRWGPGYWHQNTRLAYWPMLSSGDWDQMRAYFAQYLRVLPLATERCRRFCGHPGAFFPETMTFWGTYLEENYGWDAEREVGLPPHLPQNRFIRRFHSSGLEVVYHAVLFFRHTGDEAFLKQTLLPLATAVLDYYDTGFGRKDGKLHIAPAQVLETWWEAENPLPEIVGLQAALKGLLSLSAAGIPEERIAQWRRLLGELPPVPAGEVDGKARLLPAHRWEGPSRNVENPELYAVFPYHVAHHANGLAEAGKNSFHARAHKHDQGWAQDGMQAALLGIAWDARFSITKRLSNPSAYARFPAFWGPNFDWLPDQDQGGSASHALQLMLLQELDGELHILPAWPAVWSVDACLCASVGQRVRIQYAPGEEPVVDFETPCTAYKIHAPQSEGGRKTPA